MRKAATTLWIILVAALTGYLFYAHSILPDRFATHFDLRGQPDAYSDKTSFFLTFAMIAIFSNALTFVFFRSIERMPAAFINVPNKSFWFSTDHRRETAYGKLKTVLALAGCFTSSVVLMSLHLVVQTSVEGVFHLPELFILPVLLLVTVGFTVSVISEFKKPTED
jgi:uncharacterized membrane protein